MMFLLSFLSLALRLLLIQSVGGLPISSKRIILGVPPIETKRSTGISPNSMLCVPKFANPISRLVSTYHLRTTPTNTPCDPSMGFLVFRKDMEDIVLKNQVVDSVAVSQRDRGTAICLTSFLDGSVHRITMEAKMRIDHFISLPYLGESDYRVSVFRDKLNLKPYEKLKLGPDAARSLLIDNAGGNSEYSEAISIHYYENVFGASDFILETEVEYWRDYKMVDYICTINNQRIGVSVTRAMGFPRSSSFTREDGKNLLKRKINGLIVACDLVITKHSFTKSILHIFCQNNRIAHIMKEVYEQELEIDSMGLKVLCDVIVVITVCNEKNIYTNRCEKKNKIIVIENI